MNSAIVKRKSLDVGKGLKTSSWKRPQHSGQDVDQPVAKCANYGSNDCAIVESKGLESSSFVSRASASTSVVTGLLTTTATHSVNSNVLHPSVSNVGNTAVPCAAQITSQTVVSDVSGSLSITSSSTLTPKVTEAWSRRIQHLKFSSGPVTSVESVASTTGDGRRQTAAIACPPPHTQTNDTASAQQNTITDGIYLLWPNEDSLCWLDVAMALVVNCESLRSMLTQLDKDSCLSRLLTDFDSAQVNFRRSRQLYRCHYLCGQGKAVTLETSVGQVAVKTGGGHRPLTASLLGGSSTVIASVDLDDISSIVSADNPRSTSLEKVSREAKRLEDKAKQMMMKTRDDVFRTLQPRMHCKRGECDSALIALTEILSLDKCVQSHFTVHYTYSLTCTCCGHTESGT